LGRLKAAIFQAELKVANHLKMTCPSMVKVLLAMVFGGRGGEETNVKKSMHAKVLLVGLQGSQTLNMVLAIYLVSSL
jgi:signal recognition particle GTPase